MTQARTPERRLLLLLAAVQFTHIMDFMILMPLGPQLMRELGIGPGYFSALVSSYTLCAGAVGLMAAPYADRFDRRVLLLVTYAGFVVGTLACACARTAVTLLAARAICGAFGGVSGAVVMAIVSDVVVPERRAAAMGIVMTAFSVAAAMGVPFGLYLAHRFGWESPFFLLAFMSAIAWVQVWRRLPPVRDHLSQRTGTSGESFLRLLRNANAGRALLFLASLVCGHFIIIPFLSPYLVANVQLPEHHLALVYMVGGVLTIFTAPLLGRLADRHGRVAVFTVLVVVACLVTLALTHAGPLPLALVLTLSGLFFVFASGRFVPGQAIISLAVTRSQRGAFMGLVACIRDFVSGVTSAMSGSIVTRSASGQLEHYHLLGWMAVGCGVLSVWLARRVLPVEFQGRPGGADQ